AAARTDEHVGGSLPAVVARRREEGDRPPRRQGDAGAGLRRPGRTGHRQLLPLPPCRPGPGVEVDGPSLAVVVRRADEPDPPGLGERDDVAAPAGAPRAFTRQRRPLAPGRARADEDERRAALAVAEGPAEEDDRAVARDGNAEAGLAAVAVDVELLALHPAAFAPGEEVGASGPVPGERRAEHGQRTVAGERHACAELGPATRPRRQPADRPPARSGAGERVGRSLGRAVVGSADEG